MSAIDPAFATPLWELLRAVPKDERLTIDNGYVTHCIPVGRHCHDAADLLQKYESAKGDGWQDIASAEARIPVKLQSSIFALMGVIDSARGCSEVSAEWVDLLIRVADRVDAALKPPSQKDGK